MLAKHEIQNETRYRRKPLAKISLHFNHIWSCFATFWDKHALLANEFCNNANRHRVLMCISHAYGKYVCTHADSALFVIPLLSFILPKYKTIKTKKNYVKRKSHCNDAISFWCPWYRNKCVVSISYICIFISIHLSSKFR